MIAKPVETAIGFAMILASVPVYIVFIMWKSKPMWVRNILGEGTNWLQRLLVVMPQVKKLASYFTTFNPDHFRRRPSSEFDKVK